MGNIDDDIISALHQENNAWIKRIVKFGRIRIEPEANMGSKRTGDILVTILNYPRKEEQKVVIEVENDRKFDAQEILRKIKRDTRYPTIVIIPKECERDSWKFQESGFYVWFWTATCKWLCRDNECNKITTSSSSITPIRCTHCRKGGNFLRWAGIENCNFKEAENNPTTTYEEYQSEKNRVDAWILGP